MIPKVVEISTSPWLFVYLLSFQYCWKYGDEPDEEEHRQCLEVIQILHRLEISNSKASLQYKQPRNLKLCLDIYQCRIYHHKRLTLTVI